MTRRYIEDDPAAEESRVKNQELIEEFHKIYVINCRKNNRQLTHSQNTSLFVNRSLTRLIYPPRTHYADCIRRVGFNMYVSIKK